jgi:hypothetical protein
MGRRGLTDSRQFMIRPTAMITSGRGIEAGAKSSKKLEPYLQTGEWTE